MTLGLVVVEDVPEGEDGEGAVGLVGATVGEGRAPEVVPQQLREGRRGQYIRVRLYGAAATQKTGSVRDSSTQAIGEADCRRPIGL